MVSQLEALRQTVAVMDLQPEHGALVAYCEGLAEALDAYPERATLWREYRPALELLMAVGEAGDDDGQAALLQLVSTPVGDSSKTRTRDAGSGGRGGRGGVGSAVDAVAAAGR